LDSGNVSSFDWYFSQIPLTNMIYLYIITPYIRMLDSDWLIAVKRTTDNISQILLQASRWWVKTANTILQIPWKKLNLMQIHLHEAFYVTSFGKIKQIHHVRSWKQQTKGIIYLASVLNNIRCN
jgi:hypothetical protein